MFKCRDCGSEHPSVIRPTSREVFESLVRQVPQECPVTKLVSSYDIEDFVWRPPLDSQ
jgi:hypothetical protein